MKETRTTTIGKGMALLLAMLLMFLAVSCSSSSDQDFPDPNAASEESASIQFLVTGIESGMRLEFPIYIRVVSVLGRETFYFEPSDPRYTGELLFGPIDPGGFLLTRPWAARYRIVKDCNILLERAAELTASDSRAATEGFARTMMAYQLLLNLNYTDANGIRVDVAGDPLGPFVSKTAALTAIAGLLDEALGNLSSGGTSFPFSVSAGFAGFDTPATFARFNRALRARVAAYMADWNGVMNALSGSFIDSDASMGLGAYHVYSTGSGDQLNPIFESPTADFVKFMGHPTFRADAEAGDSRYSSKIRERAVATTFDGLTSNLGIILAKSNTDPFPIIRNEELILLRAEANIQLGELGAAQSDINTVRAAAGLGEVTLSNTDGALSQLFHERRYSLFAEGHRWIDMRRYGHLDTLPIDRAGDVVIEMMPIPNDENQ